MPAAYQGIRDMCQLLGDKYTRFLTPAQYKTITQLYQVRFPTPPSLTAARGLARRRLPSPARALVRRPVLPFHVQY